MQRKVCVRSLFLLWLMFLSGCSPSVALCEQAEKASTRLRGQNCPRVALANFALTTCEYHVALCSPEEMAKLKESVTCMEKLSCTGPTDSDFPVSYFLCERFYSGTPTKCVKAVFPEASP